MRRCRRIDRVREGNDSQSWNFGYDMHTVYESCMVSSYILDVPLRGKNATRSCIDSNTEAERAKMSAEDGREDAGGGTKWDNMGQSGTKGGKAGQNWDIMGQSWDRRGRRMGQKGTKFGQS